jgi:type II secretory pathway component PulF
VNYNTEREIKRKAIETFDEPVYLHQVVAVITVTAKSRIIPDLKEALTDWNETHEEWRVHFHVPLFVSTLMACWIRLKEILFRTLALHAEAPIFFVS